jgi:hypothetical protein
MSAEIWYGPIGCPLRLFATVTHGAVVAVHRRRFHKARRPIVVRQQQLDLAAQGFVALSNRPRALVVSPCSMQRNPEEIAL